MVISSCSNGYATLQVGSDLHVYIVHDLSLNYLSPSSGINDTLNEQQNTSTILPANIPLLLLIVWIKHKQLRLSIKIFCVLTESAHRSRNGFLTNSFGRIERFEEISKMSDFCKFVFAKFAKIAYTNWAK